MFPAFFLSKFMLGHYFAAIDIMTFWHILIGGWGMYKFLRLAGLDEKSSFIGGLLWPLNSHCIFLTANWFTVSVYFGWLPWIFYFCLKFISGGGFLSLCLLVLCRLFAFSHGHAQYFVYSAIFEGLFFLAVVYTQRRFSRDLLISYGLSWLWTFILSLPLTLTMLHASAMSKDRSDALQFWAFASGGNNLFLWLFGAVWPFPFDLQHSAHIRTISSVFFSKTTWFHWFVPYLSHISYAGLFMAFYAVLKRQKAKPLFSPFAWLFIFSLLWSIGGFDRIVYCLPYLNRFRYPIKLVLYVHFFLIGLACLGYSLFEALWTGERAKKTVFVSMVVLIFINLTGLYAFAPRRNFMTHEEAVPSGVDIKGDFRDGRIITVGEVNGGKGSFAELDAFNYSTLFGTYHFSGVQNILPRANVKAAGMLEKGMVRDTSDLNNNFGYFRAWGVKYYFIDKLSEPKFKPLLDKNGIVLQSSDTVRSVFTDAKAAPLVYLRDGGKADYQITTNAITIDLDSAESNLLVLNFLYHPGFNASVDGYNAELALTPYGQISIPVEKGSHRILVRYLDTYLLAGGCFAIVAFLSGLWWFVFKRCE